MAAESLSGSGFEELWRSVVICNLSTVGVCIQTTGFGVKVKGRSFEERPFR